MMYGGKTRVSYLESFGKWSNLQRRVMIEYRSPMLVPKSLSMPASRAFLTISFRPSIMVAELTADWFDQ
jgi:hypothetical protein